VQAVPPADTFNEDNGAFGIIEGPVWTGDALYVSEIGPGQNPPPSRILKVTPSGVVTVARSDAGTNGLAVDASGQLYGASHKVGGLVRIDLGAPDEVLVSLYDGARLDSPNDLALRSDGTIYFTDPSYQAPQPQPQATTRLYRWSAGSGIAALADLEQPNGVTLSLDQASLYVATTRSVYRYPVNADGSLGSATTFAEGGSDGMGIDCAGNLYVTRGSQVIVFSPQGSELGRLSVPGVQSVTNVAFGGADRKLLYVTALGTANQKGLFQVQLEVPGLPY
jgi:gluconolactonase